MTKQHHYSVALDWTGNKGEGTTHYKAYTRDYTVTMAGRPPILGSSDPSFLGDPARHNPEELFVAAVSSCHMLWYLHLCSVAGIVVMDYKDAAEAEMVEHKDGSGEFSHVTLHPHVTITDASQIAKAEALHEKANKMCFIARSITAPVHHVPTTVVG